MKKDMRRLDAGYNWMWLPICCLAILLSMPTGAQSEVHGEGGGSGCGDVFGDLIHILRDAETGQPIFEKRPVSLPGDIPSFDYCPIPIDVNGDEIGFATEGCDALDPEATVEVDYFGRLNGGRTKERNNRMHFNEVISNIKEAGVVKQDETGRLLLGYDCEAMSCDSWSTIDSPMESMALYTRLMKYGHFQTDSNEEDLWAHGDSALETQYHPALDAADWAKFKEPLTHLAPAIDDDYGPEALDDKDFTRAAIFLSAAANKTGKITVDLVQYINRFLKITKTTDATSSTLDTLPALIRDGDTINASTGEVEERFVDFGAMEYIRVDWHEEDLKIIRPTKKDAWGIDENVSLLEWLEFINGESPEPPSVGIKGFVEAGSDGLRTIEFVHNYDPPVNLGWDFK